MPALAPLPQPAHEPPAHARPRLRAVPPPRPRRRLPSARAVAFYGLGLVAGFLLAGLASLPGGAEVVGWQLVLAAAACAVTALAALRARAVARRGGRRAPAPSRTL